MKKTAFIILAFITFISCKKNDLGGKATIQGKVAHHSKAIPNASIFIKFDAQEFPGEDTTVYDAKIYAGADGSYSVKVYKGNYYLYARGIDNSAVPPLVVGGVPVKVRSKQTANVDIPVTED